MAVGHHCIQWLRHRLDDTWMDKDLTFIPADKEFEGFLAHESFNC